MTQSTSISRILLALCLGMLAFSGSAWATPATPPTGAIFVATTGDDVAGAGTIASPYKTVQHALDAAWDTIQSTTCTYQDTWRLFDQTVLWADNTTTTTLQATRGKAALVVGNCCYFNRTADADTKNELFRLGYDVEVVDDNLISNGYTGTTAGYGADDFQQPTWGTTQANAKDLVVISNTADVNNIKYLRGTTAPVVSMNPSSWWAWGFVNASADPAATANTVGAEVNTMIKIETPSSVLSSDFAAGQLVDVYRYNMKIAAAKIASTSLVAGSTALASCSTGGGTGSVSAFTYPCLFVTETGAALTTYNSNNVATSRARFAGFFLGSNGGGGRATEYDINLPDYPNFSATDIPAKTICVAAGTYPVDQPITPFKNVTVQGGWNAAFTDQISTRTTTIDGQYKTRLVVINPFAAGMIYNDMTNSTNRSMNSGQYPQRSTIDYVTFNSLTLSRGRMEKVGAYGCGGAVWIGNGPFGDKFTQCTFFDNAADYGGGAVFMQGRISDSGDSSGSQLYGFPLAPLFDQCTFTSNTLHPKTSSLSSYGGSAVGFGPAYACAGRLNRCLFTHNDLITAFTSKGVIYSGAQSRYVRLTNSIFVNNTLLPTVSGASSTARPLISIYAGNSAARGCFIVNNTIHNNKVSGGLVAQTNAGQYLTFANNALTSNTSTVAATAASAIFNDAGGSTGVVINKNNLYYGNLNFTSPSEMITASVNIAAAPGYVSGNPSAYNLQAANSQSALVNKGTKGLGLNELETDFLGVARPMPEGKADDIGAYEFNNFPAVNAVRDWTLF